MTTMQSPNGCPVSAQAEQFDPFRGPYQENPADALAWACGNHLCSGAGVARQEMQAILEELTKRVPHMRLSEGQEFTYLPTTSFRGPRRLLVEWDPSENPQAGDRP